MVINLQQKLFKIGFVNDLPFFSLNPNDPQKSTGIDGKIIMTISKYLNFTYEYVDCKTFGIQKQIFDNDSWNGIIGKLIKKEIDLGVGGVVMYYDRTVVVPFLDTYWMDRLAFTLRPSQSTIDFDLLFRPLQNSVWYCLLLSFSLFFLFDYLMLRLFPTKSTSSLFWIVFCYLFRQSTPLIFKLKLSAKFCTIFAAFAMLIISNYYSGGLCSLLAIPRNLDIDTVNKLADACKSKQIVPLSLDPGYFKKMNDTNIYSLNIISKTIQPTSNIDEAINKILNYSIQQRYTFLYPRERLKFSQIKFSTNNQLYVSPDTEDASFFPLHISIPIQRNFRYRNEFVKIISHLIDAGLLRLWRNQEIIRIESINRKRINQLKINNDIDNDNDDNGDGKINLKNFQTIYYIYLLCLSFSLIIFLFEFLYSLLIY